MKVLHENDCQIGSLFLRIDHFWWYSKIEQWITADTPRRLFQDLSNTKTEYLAIKWTFQQNELLQAISKDKSWNQAETYWRTMTAVKKSSWGSFRKLWQQELSRLVKKSLLAEKLTARFPSTSLNKNVEGNHRKWSSQCCWYIYSMLAAISGVAWWIHAFVRITDKKTIPSWSFTWTIDTITHNILLYSINISIFDRFTLIKILWFWRSFSMIPFLLYT